MSDRAFALGFVLLVALAIGGIVTALVAGARAGREPESEPQIAASCAEWSDGCTVCRRTPAGPACSTPGFACVRTAPVCLSR